MKQRHRLSLTAVTVLVLTLGVTPLASAAIPDSENPPVSPADVRDQYTNEELFYSPEVTDSTAFSGEAVDGTLTFGTAAWVVACTPEANGPHISGGAGGVIFKTRVGCTGTGDYPPTVYVTVRSALFHIPSDSPDDTDNLEWQDIASSSQGRDIAVNGAKETFYTPRMIDGVPTGVQGKGHWQGTSTVEIVDPPGDTIGTDTSTVMWWNTYA